jgi:hypothetical protein
MTEKDRKKAGWKAVSQLKTDGSCSSPFDSDSDLPALSSDDETGSFETNGFINDEEDIGSKGKLHRSGSQK